MDTTFRLPIVFCFSGQGSQYYGMASTLFDDDAVFRQWMLIGDEVVRDRHGASVVEAIYDPARRLSEPFDRLELTHPAIFMVQYALARMLLHRGVRPDRLFGVSLGEMTAAAVAGMAVFEPMLRAISDQPAVYRRTCEPGGMIAVLGDPSIHAASPLLSAASEIAGINAGSHFVLSAPATALTEIESELRAHDVAMQRLPVPFAFHSKWVEPAADGIRAVFDFALRPPVWPCWSSLTGSPMRSDDAGVFWEVVRRPMNVRAAVRNMEAEGGAIYVDLSPSGSLAAILPQIIEAGSPSRVMSILSPFGRVEERLAAVLDLSSGAAD